jgi:outer membrane receptor for ferrienterochelin and colicins
MKKGIFSAFFLLTFSSAFSQMKGIVFGVSQTEKMPLYGAKLKLLHDDKIGEVTDAGGKFEIILSKNLPDTLIISAIGYINDTVIVDKKDRFGSFEIILFSEHLLPEVVIEMRRTTQSISKLKTLHVEELTSGELRKAACCNLSESFETNASVDVNITDAVSGAKKIQMMGLDGVYTQIQVENIPYLRGLESSFGLNSIPGTWIESIQITKGTGNVVNGYESMAGLINLEWKKPQTMERFFVNGFANMFGRLELNVDASHRINSKWSTVWMAYGASMLGEIDMNKDGFKDVPTGNNISLLNRWSFNGKRMEAQLGVNAYIEQKYGGQIRVNPAPVYSVSNDSRHIDFFAKTGFFTKKPYQSIGVVYNVKYQTVDAQFGLKNYHGQEKRGYINAIYDGIIGNTNHKIKFGASVVLLDINQHLDTIKSDRIEIVPGMFAEYTYTGLRITTVLGSRLDYHNLFGVQFSPRLHSKVTLTETTDLRLTAGKGWRVPNYMIDNISLLASSKSWVVPNSILPEISWNFGGSVVQEFTICKQKSHLTIDFYHTLFENQLVVDRDLNPNLLYFNNLNGRSFSNALQVEFDFSPVKNLDIRAAYKLLDVRALYGGKLQQQVMLPRNRGFLTVGYVTRNKRWEANSTLSVIGMSRLPYENLPPGQGIAATESKPYSLVNLQITHVMKKVEVYVGGENLTNFKQKNAIVDAQNPFGNYFDATKIWGPVMGVMVYGGFRYKIKKKLE